MEDAKTEGNGAVENPVTKKELVATFKSMVEKMGLVTEEGKPYEGIDKMSKDEVHALVVKESGLLKKADKEDLSEIALKTLETLGLGIWNKKPTAKAKKASAPKERSRYGHIPGSMSAFIDDLLWEGVNMDTVVKRMQKAFPKKDEAHLKAKFRIHKNYLPDARGITVTEKDGVFKADKEKIAA
jgi:hypothetical protein